ncbi:MAG: threonine ammonia-lyase [Actinomycetota bacterium]|nr:threonine ammonia-lyase [Actinomycetota bacterium]
MLFKDIEKAVQSIKPYVQQTPLVFSNYLSRLTGGEVYLKCENLQDTGSFKIRGAYNKILLTGAKKVITASMGNHAQGVACAAGRLGARALIVMPETVSAAKEEAVRAYGAEVVLRGEGLTQALEYAQSQKGWFFIHPYDDEDVMAGQGTVAAEISSQMRQMNKKPDLIIVPVGGGGLAAGISLAIKKSYFPAAKVMGVQSQAAPSALLSFNKKEVVPSAITSRTLADGIAVANTGEKTLPVLLENIDEIFPVEDELIANAMFLLMERKKLVVEGAGATPLALVLKQPELFKGKRSVLVLSGGNVDFTVLDRIVRLGLMAQGRIGTFRIEIEDVPGALNQMTSLLASRKANILDIHHERYRPGSQIYHTSVEFVVETRSRNHFNEILLETGGEEIKSGE